MFCLTPCSYSVIKDLSNKSIDASSSFEPQQTHMVPMPEIIKIASEFKPAVSHLRQRK